VTVEHLSNSTGPAYDVVILEAEDGFNIDGCKNFFYILVEVDINILCLNLPIL